MTITARIHKTEDIFQDVFVSIEYGPEQDQVTCEIKLPLFWIPSCPATDLMIALAENHIDKMCYAYSYTLIDDMGTLHVTEGNRSWTKEVIV